MTEARFAVSQTMYLYLNAQTVKNVPCRLRLSDNVLNLALTYYDDHATSGFVARPIEQYCRIAAISQRVVVGY